MATLGWIKVGVSTDTSQFVKDMSASAKISQKFAKDHSRYASGVLDFRGNDIGEYAHTGELSKGIAVAAKETENFGSSLRGLAAGFVVLEGLKTGFSTVRSAAEYMKEYVTGTIEAVTVTKTLAQRTGMSSEAFGQWSYAARMAHLTQDEFATATEQMNKRLGEVAIDGAGPAGDALKRFGMDAKNVATMGTSEALSTMLGVVRQIQNPMERAAVSMDIWGRAGQGMINMAAKGSDTIKDEMAEASRLGSALTGIDSAKVVEAHDSLTKLSLAAEGFANLVVVQLSPYIKTLTDQYLEWGYSGAKSASFVTQGMEWVVKGTGLAVDAFHGLSTVFYAIEAGTRSS